jgi:hypothetical protein
LWLRCGRSLQRAGERLLREEKFDLVFFTTTQFDSFTLGPVWKRKFGVPYVLDYQDPWVNDYYSRTGTRPPGGKLKFAVSQWRARRLEPHILREAAGVIAVSNAYGQTLSATYPWFSAHRVLMIPFGAAAQDIATARSHVPARSLVDFKDGNFHHIYDGRCGPDMSISLTAIFRAFRKFRDHQPDRTARIRFHFIGTDYAPPPLGREWAMPIAKAEGVSEQVTEHCYRVPYFDALHYLVNANALLAVGSNDPTYSASKIFPYILAERPMLVVFNINSPVLAFAREADCGQRFSFDGPDEVDALADQIEKVWFAEQGMCKSTPVSMTVFKPFTAESMCSKLVGCFNAAITPSH